MGAKRSRTISRSWPAHLARRLKTLRGKMNKDSLDALLVTNKPDARYLSDFPGEDSWALVTARKLHLLSDFRFTEDIDAACPFVDKVIRTGPMSEALAKLCGELKLKRLGFQAEHLNVHTFRKLKDKLKGVKLIATTDWLIEQRAVKDSHEIVSIRRALDLQEQAYRQTMDQIRPGLSESELVTLLEYNMRWIGSDGPSFPTIVAIGSNGSRPHHLPGRTRVKPNKPILIDFGATSDGYCSDLTRVVTLGGFSRKMAEVYEIVLEAQEAAIDAIRPGVKLRAVYDVAMKVIADAGYGPNFGHGLGHGIGLDIHELPVMGSRSEGVLKPGHVVTVEPGIYLPGVGGVRIEDDVLVTEKGHRVLSSLPKTLESAII